MTGGDFTIVELLVLTACVAVAAHFLAAEKMRRSVDHTSALHSRPMYYGIFFAFWIFVPVLVASAIWLILAPRWVDGQMIAALTANGMLVGGEDASLAINEIRNVVNGSSVTNEDRLLAMARLLAGSESQALRLMYYIAPLLAAGFGVFVWQRLRPDFPARVAVEKYMRGMLFIASTIAVMTTLGIVASVLMESVRFFGMVPPTDFLFGVDWSPQTAIRDDQIGGSGAFGALPLFAGTILITLLAMLVAAPVGLMTAVYLHEYAAPGFRAVAKPVLEILAGIPTVVYGFFAAIIVAPAFQRIGVITGLDIASESAIAAGLVVGIMIIPLISSLSDDALAAVPQSLKNGSLALGATRSETLRRVMLPAALPGIVGGFLLALSRAIGETMIVVMAAGLAANLTVNPFEAVTTVTVQIVTILVGDQEFDSAKTLAAFALGFVLFLVTLLLNATGLRFVRRYRERYE
ncbi:MAG: phosphate ABC transporter permease subunit PstC [Pseudomonadota bacterium]